MLKVIYLLLILIKMLQNKNILKFNEEHEFTILLITDAHLGDNISDDYKTIKVIKSLIKNSKPDLIVIGGDLISGHRWDGIEKEFFKKNWKKATDIFLEEKIYYAFAFGTHEIESDLSGPEIKKLEKTHPYSLFDDMAKDPVSTSNFNVKIYSSFQNREKEISLLIWIFDTKGHGCKYRRLSYGCITFPQINWYKRESGKINKEQKKNVKGLAFFHIPIPEFKNVYNFYKTHGDKKESVSCPKVNTNFFKAILEVNNIKGIYIGHDHKNDFGGNYKGVDLAYNRKTGSAGRSAKKLGGRVFKIREYLNVYKKTYFQYDHYILEEDGNIVFNAEPKRQFKNLQFICRRYIRYW